MARGAIGLVVLAVVTLGGWPAAAQGPTLGGCPVLPADNIWNARVDALPVHPRSADYVASIGPSVGLHPDFGSGTWNGGPIGIPYVVVPGSQPRVAVTYDYADESDPGPFPIPPDPPIEGGPAADGDRHVLIVDQDACRLYELFAAYPQADGSWQAGSGAVFDLGSNVLRPADWTSADAAGLPILPGLARYDEVAAGEVRHALRFTARVTQRAYVWPARHFASSNTSPAVPPMGQRFRLKASFDVSPFPPAVQVILRGLQRYGMMLADNGSNWYISGVPDPRWDNDVLHALGQVKGSDFEAVDVSGLMVHPDSGQTLASTFADVPAAYWAAAWVEALAAAGVTAGCADGPPRYCPEAPVTRGEMAVFLLRAAGVTPPPCTVPRFADVPCSNPFAASIEALAARGVTAGCTTAAYCPSSPVTREQMAVFLLRMSLGPAFVPAACTAATFTDVPCSSGFAPWVYELAARGITSGCSPTTYCPGSVVTRAQMAVFLVKVFALPM